MSSLTACEAYFALQNYSRVSSKKNFFNYERSLPPSQKFEWGYISYIFTTYFKMVIFQACSRVQKKLFPCMRSCKIFAFAVLARCMTVKIFFGTSYTLNVLQFYPVLCLF